MVTIGCYIGTHDSAEKFDTVFSNDKAEYFGTEKVFEIDLPNLTMREKIEFDKLLPSETPPTKSQLPFELRDKEIRNYWKFYRHYPVFGEMQP